MSTSHPAAETGIPEDILINCTPYETRVAVLANGVVQELHVERTQSRGLVGNIYVGKVARVRHRLSSSLAKGLEPTEVHLGNRNTRLALMHHFDWRAAVPSEAAQSAVLARPVPMFVEDLKVPGPPIAKA